MSTFAEVAEGVRHHRRLHPRPRRRRTDDVVATYCPDGVFAMPGLGTFEGHDALGRPTPVGPGPQRHLVVNTLVTDWATEATAVSDVVFTRRATRAGRSSSWPATATPSTTRTAGGGSTAGGHHLRCSRT